MPDLPVEAELCDRFSDSPKVIEPVSEVFADLMDRQADMEGGQTGVAPVTGQMGDPKQPDGKQQEIIIQGSQMKMAVIAFVQKGKDAGDEFPVRAAFPVV